MIAIGLRARFFTAGVLVVATSAASSAWSAWAFLRVSQVVDATVRDSEQTTAATGAGLDLFSNPCAVYGSLRYIQLSSDTRTGRANPMRGLGVRNMDMRFGKDFPLRSEKRRLGFSADFFNVFNHTQFANPNV